MSNSVNTSLEAPRFVKSTRATDTARLMKFTKVLGGVTVILGTLHTAEIVSFNLLSYLIIRFRGCLVGSSVWIKLSVWINMSA